MLARHAAAVGLRARIKLYPGDDPIRDAGQVALIRHLRERVERGGRVGTWEFEVPIPQALDQRAIDAVLNLPAGRSVLKPGFDWPMHRLSFAPHTSSSGTQR